MTTSTRKVQAADAEAEKYWTEYYKDSGYGEAWVRDMKRRLTAELVKTTPRTAASGEESSPASIVAGIRPLATVVTDDGVHLEGLARITAGDETTVLAFIADFDHEGTVTAFDSIDC